MLAHLKNGLITVSHPEQMFPEQSVWEDCRCNSQRVGWLLLNKPPNWYSTEEHKLVAEIFMRTTMMVLMMVMTMSMTFTSPGRLKPSDVDDMWVASVVASACALKGVSRPFRATIVWSFHLCTLLHFTLLHCTPWWIHPVALHCTGWAALHCTLLFHLQSLSVALQLQSHSVATQLGSGTV